MRSRIFTSESVTEGHPDKVCDQIADAVLDAYLEHDPNSRLQCEVMLLEGKVILSGEICSQVRVEPETVVRNVLERVGYTRRYHGLSAEQSEIEDRICYDDGMKLLGAGNGRHGVVHGYATNETEEFMPLSIVLAHDLAKRMDYLRKMGQLPYLLSDGKVQVSIEYDEKGIPLRIESIVIFAQHLPEISVHEVRKDLLEKVICKIVPISYIDNQSRFFLNPTGEYVYGGVTTECGITSRKLVVDTYGGHGSYGGGGLSGKDPYQIDRSAAYLARHIAKNLVGWKVCKKVDVQLAYVPGLARPVGFCMDDYGTGNENAELIAQNMCKILDFSMDGIIDRFDMKRPLYEQLAVYGHFGRKELELPWEVVYEG